MTDLRVAEREQEPTLPVTVSTGAEAKCVKLPVAATLNTVESEAARKAAWERKLRGESALRGKGGRSAAHDVPPPATAMELPPQRALPSPQLGSEARAFRVSLVAFRDPRGRGRAWRRCARRL